MAARNPEDCDRLFSEAIARGDAGAVADLYESEGVLILEQGTFTGPAEVRGAIEGMLAAKPRMTMNVVKVIRGGDLAVVYNDWQMTVVGPDGREQQSSGKALEVVRRQADGSWKYVIDDPAAR